MKRYLPFLLAISSGFVLLGCGSKDPAPKATAPSPTKDAGATRIDIKHATDPDAKLIDTTPKDITVEELIGMKLPDDMEGGLENYGEKRIGEFEKSTYRVTGLLKSVVHRKDGDYYLVMEGKTGAKAVIEVPDPKLAKGSPILSEMQTARDAIEAKYHPTDKPKDINEQATIEGVGFYGWKGKPGAGGHGSAPRLMPGTGFRGAK